MRPVSYLARMAGKKSDIYRDFKLTERVAAGFDPARIVNLTGAMQLRMIADFAARIHRRKPPGMAAAPVPADPKRPNILFGGAVAALDFD